MYFGTGDAVPADLTARAAAARLARVEANRSAACETCLSVSNSLSGCHWELDQVPAVGDPAHVVQLGTRDCLCMANSKVVSISTRARSC
jgi:hypothetical protein